MKSELQIVQTRQADIKDLKEFIEEVSSQEDKNTLTKVLKDLYNEYHTALENLQASIEREKNYVSQEQKAHNLKTA